MAFLKSEFSEGKGERITLDQENEVTKAANIMDSLEKNLKDLETLGSFESNCPLNSPLSSTVFSRY